MFTNIRLYSVDGGKMVRIMAVFSNGKTLDEVQVMPEDGQPLNLALPFDSEPARYLRIKVEVTEDSE